MTTASLTAAACAVLEAAAPADKVCLTETAARAWHDGAITALGNARPPARPARPTLPRLVPPRGVARRRGGKGGFALLHAVAHIELNAIDLAWDMIARFAPAMPRAFADDWVRVAAEEARHFGLVAGRLAALGGAYGKLPAHDGLWQAAAATADDLGARLAVVPMVLEARGLDVTPGMIAAFERAGDGESADVLRRIYADGIGHVGVGSRWFRHLCDARGLDVAAHWRALVASRFAGTLKPPFNHAARASAGMARQLYDAENC